MSTQFEFKSPTRRASLPRSPRRLSTYRTSEREREAKEELSKIERPSDYWQDIYKKRGEFGVVSLEKTLETLTSSNSFALFRDIIIYSLEALEKDYLVSVEDVSPSHWAIRYMFSKNEFPPSKEFRYYSPEVTAEEGIWVEVADHRDAQTVLDDWMMNMRLPRILSNGDEMPKIKTFDQLMALMAKFNPYWILEMNSFKNIRNPNPRYNYNVNHEQVIQIRGILLDELEKEKERKQAIMSSRSLGR